MLTPWTTVEYVLPAPHSPETKKNYINLKKLFFGKNHIFAFYEKDKKKNNQCPTFKLILNKEKIKIFLKMPFAIAPNSFHKFENF